MMNPDMLVRYAMQFVGLPYRWGGDDPILGFDCSGFVQELLAAFGADPDGDQTAQALWDKVDWSVSPRRTGALAFYGKSAKAVSHVAMFLDETTIVEAGGGGAKTLTLADAALQNAYIRLRPFDRRKDYLGCKWPNYL